jgi:hypothetical protein
LPVIRVLNCVSGLPMQQDTRLLRGGCEGCLVVHLHGMLRTVQAVKPLNISLRYVGQSTGSGLIAHGQDTGTARALE